MALREMVQMYLEGSITQYELFATARERGLSQDFEGVLAEEFRVWDAEHPAGGTVSFSIFA